MAPSPRPTPHYMSSTVASRAKQKPRAATRPSSDLDIELPRAARIPGPMPSDWPLLNSSSFQINVSSLPAESAGAESETYDDAAELQVQQEMGCAPGSSPPRPSRTEEELALEDAPAEDEQAPVFGDDDDDDDSEASPLPEAENASAPALGDDDDDDAPPKKKRKHGTRKTKAQRIPGWIARREEARAAARRPDSERRTTRGAVRRGLAEPPSPLARLERKGGEVVEASYALRRGR